MSATTEIEAWEQPARTVSPLHAEARRLAEAGTPVLPTWPGTKTPIPQHGLNERSCDLARVDEWWRAHPDANVAIVPDDAGLAVVDIDGAEGEASWAASEGGPETCTVRTPSGGRHLYFRGELPATVSKIAPGLDTRGRGSYVLVPPSRVDDRDPKAHGKPWKQGVYTVQNDAAEAPLPAWLVEAAGRKREAATADDIPLDLPGNIARATEWLRRRDPAIEGQGGDNWTYQTFAHLFDLGLSVDKALEIAAEWNQTCVPPWDEEGLQQKAESAFVNRQNDVGAYAQAPLAQTFAPALDKLGVTLREGPRSPLSFSDLLAREVPPIRELVPGLIERGVVTFLSAPGGSHKSRLAVQMGLCLQAGQPIFGRRTEPATFVYVSYEDGPDEVARRVQNIAKRLNLPSDIGGRYFDRAGQFDPLAVISENDDPELRPFWTELHDALTSTAGHKFVVLDGTYNALHFRGAAKINEAAVYGAIALLQRLADETDSTIVALWHPSVAGQERGDASGWSVAWNNAPRARLSLTAASKSEDTYELKVEKRNHGPKGLPLTLHFDNGALLPRSEVAQADHDSRFLTACVAAAIQAAESDQPIQKQRNAPKWVFDEVEKACGFRPTKTDLKDALARALHTGRLRYLTGSKDRMAGYYPPDQARAAELAAAAKGRSEQRGGDDV